MADREDCIVCRNAGATREARGDTDRFECPRCGSFVLTGTATAVLPNKLADDAERRALMSHHLRLMQRDDRSHLRHAIDSNQLDAFWADGRLPSPLEMADNLIRWIGDHNRKNLTKGATATAETIAAMVGLPIEPQGDSRGWGWLNKLLQPSGLYDLAETPPGKSMLKLTIEGWGRYEELQRARQDSRLAFMAMQFGEPEVLNAVKNCFKPAAEEAGFELKVLTDHQGAGLIDDQIRAALLSARFVIADLTHDNSGAYWEAGFAEGLGRPVIYTCKKSKWDESKTHFDTNHMVTVVWDPDDLDDARSLLTATVQAPIRP